MDDAITRIEARFEQVDRRFDRVDQDLDRIWRRFDRVDERFERMEQHMNTRFDSLQRVLIQVGWGIAGIVVVQFIAAAVAFVLA